MAIINTTLITEPAVDSIDSFVPDAPEISEACWNWCSEQQAIHASNLTIAGISIVALAMIVLFIYTIIVKYWDYIEIQGDKEKLAKIVNLLPDFAIYLLIGFFVWFVWFS